MSNLNIRIGYRLIKSPFQYNVTYLNHDYKIPPSKSVSFYGLVEGKKTPDEIKIMIPVNDGGASPANLDGALEVATAFDNIVTNNPQYTITDATLISNYQNHVLNNADYQTHWTQAVEDYKKDKNLTDDINYPKGAFLDIRNKFFNFLASDGRPIAAGDALLHYLRSGKKKASHVSPQSFYTRFQKALRAVKVLDRHYEKELDDDEAKIIFLYAFPNDQIQDYVHHGQRNFDNETIEDIKNFFQGHFDANPPKKTDKPNNRRNERSQSSSRNRVSFVNRDNANSLSSTAPNSRRPNDQSRDRSRPPHRDDASSSDIRNQCGFCKDRNIEWADCTMHNPTTGSQTAKDFDAMRKSAQPSRPQPTTRRPASPPRRERERHSSYYADEPRRSKHSRSRSCSRSRSRSPRRSPSRDHSHDDRPRSRSSRSRHTSYIGHHDFPDDSTPIQYNSTLKRYKRSDGSFKPGRPFDSKTVNYNSPRSDNDVDHSAWNTDPETNPFHPVHFEGDGTRTNPITATYCEPDYDDDDSSDTSSNLGADARPSKFVPDFNPRDFTDPEAKQYGYWKNSKPDVKPPAGLMLFYVASFYREEIDLLDAYPHVAQHSQDIDRRYFLTQMCLLYQSLTSANEPDIFEITKDQKYELNLYIHFAQTNWDARQIWYHERRRSAINKSSEFNRIPRPWKKIKPPSHCPDYVTKIRTQNSKPKANASRPVQKNN